MMVRNIISLNSLLLCLALGAQTALALDTAEKSACVEKGGEWVQTSERGLCLIDEQIEGIMVGKYPYLQDEAHSTALSPDIEDLIFRQSFKRGKLHGPSKVYYAESGTLAAEGSYTQGELDGEFTYYDKAGRMFISAQYKNGKLDGDYYYYNPLCKLSYKSTYKLGEETHTIVYGQKGNPIKQGGDVRGIEEGVWRHYYDVTKPMQLQEEGWMKGGMRQGSWRTWTKSGSPWLNFSYEDDVLTNVEGKRCRDLFGELLIDYEALTVTCVPEDGFKGTDALGFRLEPIVFKNSYYSNGALKRVEEIQDSGLLKITEMHPSGELLTSGLWDVNGMIPVDKHVFWGKMNVAWEAVELSNGSGLWVRYWPNKTIREDGEFRDNRRVGTWGFRDEKGRIIELRNYGLEGKIQDITKHHANGLLSEHIVFRKPGVKRTHTYYSPAEIKTKVKNYDTEGSVESIEEYYPNGTMKAIGGYYEKGEFNEDRRQGIWSFYTSAGKPWYQGDFDMGYDASVEAAYCSHVNGEWVVNNKDRAVGCEACRVCTEKNGKSEVIKIGGWRYWNEDGVFQLRMSYAYNQLHGMITLYDDEGRVQVEAKYDLGKSSFDWTTYDVTGAIVFVGQPKLPFSNSIWKLAVYGNS